MADRLAALAVAVPFLVGTLVGAGDADRREAFRFQGADVVESSGLVVLDDGLFVTTNDSGDTGRVFTVDPRTGRTVGTTTWSEDPEDVEALAPAGEGEVWVADIGDNGASRESVSVVRVPVGEGDRVVDPPAYELVYPDGAQDAESLLAHPATGRLYVASKGLLGGRLYAAPRRLSADRPNRLQAVGDVLPIATDGAFLASGDRLVLRDYGRLVGYAFPSLEVLGEVRLPAQRQGEGLAIARAGTAYVSSEGREAPVLEVALPPLDRPGEDPDPTPEATPTPPAGSREGAELPETDPGPRPVWPWFLTGWLGLGVIVALLLALRRR